MNAPRVPAGRLRIGLAVAAALLASACAAGQQAQTADEKPTLDGTNADVGAIALRAIAIEAPTQVSYKPGDDAPISIVLVNNGSKPDTLTSVRSSEASGWSASGSDASQNSVPVAPASRVSFGVPESKDVLQLTGLKRNLYPGESLNITFTFAKAGAVTVDVPVALTETPPEQSVPPAGPTAG